MTHPRRVVVTSQSDWYASGVSVKGMPSARPNGRPNFGDDGDVTQVDRAPLFENRSASTAPFDELFDAEETGVSSGNIWMSLTGFARLRQETAARTAWKRALPLRRILSTRVRLLGYSPRLSTLAGGVVAFVAVTTALLVGLVRSWNPAPPQAAPAVPVSVAFAAASAPPADPPELSDAQRASLGDDAAMKTLAAREPEELSPDELLALLEGRRIQRQQLLAEVGERFIASPAVLRDEAVADQLRRDLDDPMLRVDVLRSLARVAAPIGPDLLYSIREDPAHDATTRWLAGALLRTLEVRQHLSRALEVTLELEEVSDCSRAAELVAMAIEHGDRRALAPVTRLTETSGCGVDGRRDCFPCLRGHGQLLEALEAIAERRPPTLPMVTRTAPAVSSGDAPSTSARSRAFGTREPERASEAGLDSSSEGRREAPPEHSTIDRANQRGLSVTQDPGF